MPTPTPAPGPNDFFVSPSGSDSNSGSASAPWATLQHAANSVGAGARVLVADGTYNECRVVISNSGTSSAPITFQSQNKWGAHLAIPSSCGVGFDLNGSFIVIKNFDISGAAIPSSVGIYMHSGSNHTAYGNKIHNIGNFSHTDDFGESAIFSQTPNDMIDSNFIFSNGRTNNTNCSGCLAHDHGLYIDGALGSNAITIQNNVMYDNQAGFDIQLYPGSMSNVNIINNTLDGSGPAANGVIGCIVQGVVLSNSRISNNICTNPHGGVMIHTGCCGDSASNVTIDHNITNVGSMVQVNNGYTITSDNVFNANASAMYNNFGALDFSLTATSPALGIATGATAPPVDIVGTPRPQNGRFDAGAYQFPH
jgi:hypothetical protein